MLLFGEVLFDCFPERDIPGGAPFNVAHHLRGLARELGMQPVLISRVGDDARGRRLLEVIRSAGLAVHGIQVDSDHPTGAVRLTEQPSGGHRFDIPADQAWDFIQPAPALAGVAGAPHWLYFGTLAQRAGSHAALRSILQSSHARGFLDVNLRDPWVREDVLRWSLQQAEVVKVSEEELLRMAALFAFSGESPLQLGERLVQAFGMKQLLVTNGEQGAWLLTSAGEYARTAPATAPANVTPVVDTVGAGDAFAAVYLLGLTLDWPVQQSLDRAHAFAARVCGVRGAIPEQPAFYESFIHQWQLVGEHVA
mgnify:CR=1 FL=1